MGESAGPTSIERTRPRVQVLLTWVFEPVHGVGWYTQGSHASVHRRCWTHNGTCQNQEPDCCTSVEEGSKSTDSPLLLAVGYR